jgi:endonuclease/exonuclease/phosphatase family metal-dependent hydrolase
MRVMTYNIKGHGGLLRRAHLDGIAQVILETQPDVVGLQEVHRRGWKARGVDQAAELERLTGMQMAFGRSLVKGDSEYGNAVLTRGRITATDIAPLPGSGEPRTLLGVTIDLDGRPLVAYVTHLAAWGRFGAGTRQQQAEAVAKLTSSAALPFVLTGDFNSSPSSAELRVFHDGALVTSCFTAPIVTHRATRQCLDYIFAGPGWQIRGTEIVTRGPSDHWPLVAELERAG